jgi:hypothetical protein
MRQFAANGLEFKRLLRDKGRPLTSRKVGGQTGIDLLPDLESTEIKAANMEEPDDAGLIDEEPVRNHIEVEKPSENIGAVDRGWEAVGIGECSYPFWVGVDGDA